MGNKYEESLKNICSNCEKLINQINVPIRENEISNGNCGHRLCPYRHIDNSYCEDIKTLQELVDKSIPKKVERDLEGYDAMPTLTTECPNCKEMIWKCKDDERFKYCYCCGQRLDWGETK